MRVLVDTPIWSLALRRRRGDLSSQEHRYTRVLAELIREGRAQLVGPVRQELLSGIRDISNFQKLRGYLRAFDDPQLTTADYEQAAEMSNQCRKRGITASAIDALICAVSQSRQWEIFTTNRDFIQYAKALPIQLFRSGV
jgi:predicted nucleic acid-binding protein